MFDVAKWKLQFFDAAAVKKATDKDTRARLSRFGAFVRRRAQTSIRKRKRTSPPGSPPYSHAGTLRKLLFFAYDPARNSVVVGPAAGGSATGAPERLEYGGPGVVRSGPAKGRTAVVRPRPFMLPAFRAELPNFKRGIR